MQFIVRLFLYLRGFRDGFPFFYGYNLIIHIIISRYNLIFCRIFSIDLRHFTLVLLQNCHIFTLILLQTFATISIYWQLYTWPNPTLMRFCIL